jgi:mannose-1-phosphate guanylyltransferase
LIGRRDAEATMAVMPADHVIQPPAVFREALAYAATLVNQDSARIVTFGIKPTYPAETFGYIERGELIVSPSLADGTATGVPLPTFAVRRFREKPKADVARQYVESGRFYWNSGIFVWRAATIMAALERFEPEMAARIATIAGAVGSSDFPATLEREFTAIRGKSIDYAVMERYDDIAVVEAPFQWDDVGSWQSLSRTRGADAEGNTVIGRHLGIRTRGSIVRTDPQHLVVTLGVRDLIVVHTPDATLVADKHDEECIRQVVEMLKEKGWEQYL